jgi:hypothetical protein
MSAVLADALKYSVPSEHVVRVISAHDDPLKKFDSWNWPYWQLLHVTSALDVPGWLTYDPLLQVVQIVQVDVAWPF